MQRLLDDTPVRLDGRRITKPATPVRVGQVVTLPFHGAVKVFQIRSLPHRRGPVAEAKTHIRELVENANHSHQEEGR
ncbi:RNA-binding S4 domain-containing protein [Sphingomicrobium sp. B8]|uniref:RNA-binding S4 domain-containing protein n=1 Tax=Sphingomicrobium clamense TaxID=2851013 RepID=A0ABS6V3B8_9SPHN|nr:RNA-binding S4 domain-containing protein [Sphingomicrobium sp. B8]